MYVCRGALCIAICRDHAKLYGSVVSPLEKLPTPADGWKLVYSQVDGALFVKTKELT